MMIRALVLAGLIGATLYVDNSYAIGCRNCGGQEATVVSYGSSGGAGGQVRERRGLFARRRAARSEGSSGGYGSSGGSGGYGSTGGYGSADSDGAATYDSSPPAAPPEASSDRVSTHDLVKCDCDCKDCTGRVDCPCDCINCSCRNEKKGSLSRAPEVRPPQLAMRQ